MTHAFRIPWKRNLTASFPSSCCKKSCQELAITEQLTALAKWISNCFAQQDLPLILKELSKQTKGKSHLLNLQIHRCVASSWHQNIWRSLLGHLGFRLTITATYKASLTKSYEWHWKGLWKVSLGQTHCPNPVPLSTSLVFVEPTFAVGGEALPAPLPKETTTSSWT